MTPKKRYKEENYSYSVGDPVHSTVPPELAHAHPGFDAYSDLVIIAREDDGISNIYKIE
jgi:hypothetical protein